MLPADVYNSDNAPEDGEAYRPERGKSRVWLDMIAEAESAYKTWQDKADSIDERYASLAKLSTDVRDRQFQIFWANIQVLAPSIYARPPVPVVVPRFKDRRPLYRTSSEFLERATAVAFDLADINASMLLVRDDLTIVGRGALWVRYETRAESDTPTEKVCIEHVDRKDFLNQPARNWTEVEWVAKRAWMTLDAFKARFRGLPKEEYQGLETEVMVEGVRNGAATREPKIPVWEVWSKKENKVVWVTEGVERTLDEGEPHLKLRGFFPCPRPAFATVQRGSLLPVPDFLFYKDQVEEITQLTTRIHMLADALQMKGFYPAGGDIGNAVEAALNTNSNNAIMVPVSNWAQFGSGGEVIIWLPIQDIAATIVALVTLRKQLIDDVYQIVGLSDIMRGSTEKDETATAQQLKSQFGSVRIRDKQTELVRIARDTVAIAAEIMAENFGQSTLVEMAQMEIPTNRDISVQVKQIEAQAQQITAQLQRAQQDPRMQQLAQQNPEQAEQIVQQAQQQIQEGGQQVAKLKEQVTIEQVMQLLRDEKTRPFVLDIETDSTIQPDEQAEKQGRAEFLQVLGGVINQMAPVLQAMPNMAPFVGEVIKWALAPYRVGRQLEGVLDDAVDQLSQKANQAPPNPEAEKLQAQQQLEQQKLEAEDKRAQAEMQSRQQEAEFKAQVEMQKLQIEAQANEREQQGKMAELDAKMQAEREKHQLEMAKLQLEVQAKQQELQIKAQSAQIDAALQQQSAQIQTESAQQDAAIKQQQARQQSELAAQKAMNSQGGER